jgi:hypothetical protein
MADREAMLPLHADRTRFLFAWIVRRLLGLTQREVAMKLKQLFFAATVSLFMSLYINAATVTVTNTNDSGPGSIRQAITNAAPGDTINFSVTGTITLTSGQLVVDKGLTIRGAGAGLLSISGNNTSRVFFINNGATVTLDGMTVRNGAQNSYGSGIDNEGILTITNSTISNNAAYSGGGGVLNGGTMIISRSIISSNSSGIWGGGIFNGGPLTVSDSTISDNYASSYPAGGSGGGIYNQAGSLDISNSNISGNITEDGDGGGICNEGAIVTIDNSTVSGNAASFGGSGIYNTNYIYCDEFDNCSSISTGYIHITNSTIANNTLGSDGTHGGAFAESVENLVNTIVTDAIDGTIETASHNLIGTAASSGGIQNGVNGNIVGVNPMLGPLQNNGGLGMTFALLAGSPAIDAGDNSLAVDSNGQPLLYDQRGVGFSRIVNGTVDIGAFERQGTTAAMVSVSGRVLSSDGRGVRGAYVTISGPGGTRTMPTGRLGAYRFDDVATGADYTISAAARRFHFEPRVVEVNQALSNVDLIAEN